MSLFIPEPIRSLPWRLMLLLFAMAGFGATVLYSAAGGHFMPWAAPHMVRFVGALGIAILISRQPLDRIKAVTFPLYFVILGLLVFVELVGAVGGGSQRWINLGFMSLQPSELMKPAIVLVVAWFFDRLPPSKVRTFDALWPPALLLAVPFVFVLIQPDLGTATAILVGAVTVIFLAGVPIRLFVGAAGALAILAPIAWFFGLHDYQRNRILVFMDPESDPLGTGYHISQSKIAIGSGGLTGKGFLNGTQSHLDYLPEGHTDFVFATMSEEWGFLGGIGVLLCFFLLFRWGLTTAMASPSRYGQLVAAGLTTTIFFYAAINMLMVTGLAPVVGIPLPFLSHGGSSMLTIMLCIGVIMAVERQPRAGRGTLR